MAKISATKCDGPGCRAITQNVGNWIRIQCRPHTGKGQAENMHVVIRMPGRHGEHRVSPQGGFAFCGIPCMMNFVAGLQESFNSVPGAMVYPAASPTIPP